MPRSLHEEDVGGLQAWPVVLRLRWAAALAVLLMLVALFVGGAQPQAAGLVPAPWDKLAHVAYFFVFTFLLSRFVGLPLVAVFVLALLVGAADEIHQSFLPGRVAGWEDWLADAVGTGLGLIMLRKRGLASGA